MRLLNVTPTTAVLGVAIAALSLATAMRPVRAETVEEFYRGKTINLLIGYSVGGGYDLYGRLVARYLGKHIPGQPSVVPQNMTGAGSLRSAQHIYSVAPKDGTTIGTFARAIGITPLLGGAQFDGTRFTWLGSVTHDTSLCFAWDASAIRTWQDMLTRPVVLGGEGPGSDPDLFALLYKNVFGAKIQLVTGYHGTHDITLAMERREVDGLCGISWSTVKANHAAWLSEKKIHLLVQAAMKKEPELPDVPLALDLTRDPEQLQILKLIIGAQTMARPFAAPPGIPEDRKAALVRAFAATVTDPQFVAEAQKLNLDVNLIPATTIDGILAEAYATPKAVIDKTVQAIAK
jgi:tripartite-type tricarboxylate transporter receptor subunit TctC